MSLPRFRYSGSLQGRLHRSPYCLRARSSGKSTEKCSSSKRFLLLIGAWLLARTANAQGALSPEQEMLPVVHVRVGAYSGTSESAKNDADRFMVLMFRTFLKPDNFFFSSRRRHTR